MRAPTLRKKIQIAEANVSYYAFWLKFYTEAKAKADRELEELNNLALQKLSTATAISPQTRQNCEARSTTHASGAPGSLISSKIEKLLNLFPEVTWDRWAGELDSELGIGVFGWIARDDGKADFAYLRIDQDGAWLVATSSAKHSADFCKRLHFDTNGEGHNPCKRVEDYFHHVNASHL